MRDNTEITNYVNCNNTYYRQLCTYCKWPLHCFLLVNNISETCTPEDLNKFGNFSYSKIENYWSTDNALGNVNDACKKIDYNNASIGLYLAGKCDVGSDSDSAATTTGIIVLGLVPLVALSVFRLLDGVGFRNYVERLYWSTIFTILSMASNFTILKYYRNGLDNKGKGGMLRWPCSEYGWTGAFKGLIDLFTDTNWGLLASVLSCWIYTTLSRKSNHYVKLRLMEMKDGRFAVNPLMIPLYMIHVIIKMIFDLKRFFISIFAGRKEGPRSLLINEPNVINVAGYNKILEVNSEVCKMFDVSSDGAVMASVELLGSNVLVVLIVLVLQTYSCPGGNSARNALLSVLSVNILNSIWKTLMLGLRQFDMHAVFSRRRRLYVSDKDKGSKGDGVRTGMEIEECSLSELVDLSINNTLFKRLMVDFLGMEKEKFAKRFGKFILNSKLSVENADGYNIPESKILATSFRMATTNVEDPLLTLPRLAELSTVFRMSKRSGRLEPVPMELRRSTSGHSPNHDLEIGSTN